MDDLLVHDYNEGDHLEHLRLLMSIDCHKLVVTIFMTIVSDRNHLVHGKEEIIKFIVSTSYL